MWDQVLGSGDVKCVCVCEEEDTCRMRRRIHVGSSVGLRRRQVCVCV